ncbi:MAG: asparaginase [Bacteroidia bacterium]|nr:asparaginase [Bacteroidia bacterium]
MKKKILLIYTGGTIGMMRVGKHNTLVPVDLDSLLNQIPEINRLMCDLDYVSVIRPIDSSNMTPSNWLEIGYIIAENYEKYDGFVVLHGSDTMAYTASALSFILEGLSKPVVLTGSQLPIGEVRSDARDNMLTSLEIVSNPMYCLPEVAVCFDSKLFRGNRTVKYSSEKFQAFDSPNYPQLAESGVHLEFYTRYWLSSPYDQPFRLQMELDTNIALIKFYPGIPRVMIESIFNLKMRGIVLESFGVGNLPTAPWFLDLVRDKINSGMIVMNVTQCPAGKVEQSRYETGKFLEDIGVISGKDITTASALAKLMYLFGKYKNDLEKIRFEASRNLRGEISY